MNNSLNIERIGKNGTSINVIMPKIAQTNSVSYLLEYIKFNHLNILEDINRDGGLLFRGFDVDGDKEFNSVRESIFSKAEFTYMDGNSPRTKLSSNRYTSTEYPKEFAITMHNELSYSNSWPKYLFFYCETPASRGGETPICDSREVLKKLGPDIVSKFEKYGVQYNRYLSDNGMFGKSWQNTFETKDKELVEKYLQHNNIKYKWNGNDLFLTQFGLGVAIHPITGEKVWFNQADQFHPSSLPKEVYEGLKLLFEEDKNKFPHYALYGNGEEIPEEYLKTVTECHFSNSLNFAWKKKDILVLDNMLMSHGRNPFEGERRIYVSMV